MHSSNNALRLVFRHPASLYVDIVLCAATCAALLSPADLRRLDWAETNTDQDIFPPGEVYTCAGSYILKQVSESAASKLVLFAK